MSKSKKYQDNDKDRSRTWAFEIYPDSADSNWYNQLCELMIHAYISPLHDQDIDEDGKPKKPHYHIMLMYDTVQYPHQVIMDAIAVAGKGLGGCCYSEDYDNWIFDDVKTVDKFDRVWIGFNTNLQSYGTILKVRSKSGMARYLCLSALSI